MSNILLKTFYCVSCGNNLEDAIIQDGELLCPKCKRPNGIVLIGAESVKYLAAGAGGNGGRKCKTSS